MRRISRVVCASAGAILATAGAVCLAAASLGVEQADGFYVVVGSHRLMLPESGMLGDANTYFAEWHTLGLFCLGSAALTALFPRAGHPAARGLMLALLALATAAIVLFARDLSRL